MMHLPMAFWRRAAGLGTQSYADLILSRSGLVAYWRLGEASGTSGTGSMIDASGNSRHMTPFGSPTFGVAGAIAGDADTAVQFPTNSDYAESVSAAPFTNLLPLSVDFWFYYPNTGAGGRGTLLSKSDFILGIYSLTGFANENIRALVPFSTTSAEAISINMASALTVGWHHLAFVIDTDKVPRLHYDGSEISYSTQTTGVGTRTEADTNNRARLARDRFSGGHAADVRLDEVAVLNAALTSTQILAHYNKGTGA